MYDYLFQSKSLTVVLALALTLAACLSLGMVRHAWRTLAFNLTPALASAFFVAAWWAPAHVEGMDLVAGLLFEFTVLVLYCHLFLTLYRSVHRIDVQTSDRLLRGTLLLQLVVAWPMLGSEGFGLFSEGSRIDYLYAGSAAKYLTYGGFMIAGAQAGLVARRVSIRRGLGLVGAAVVVLNLGLSLLSGSKGAFFLWILAIVALVDYRRARIGRLTLAAFASFLAGALAVTAVVASEFIGITLEQFSQLALNRFFLINDARALAFDMRSMDSASVSLLSESFRSVTSLFGSPPNNPPIGVLLYDRLFGTAGNLGANGSLSALMAFYSPPGYMLLPVVLAVVVTGLLVLAARGLAASMRRAETSYVVWVLAAFCLTQLSQDFLAFQVVLPLSAIVIAAAWLYDQTHAKSSAPRRGRTVVATDTATQPHRPRP